MKKETKEERFIRVGEKRVQNILNGINSLTQMSNSKVYKWNKGQLDKIFKAIELELDNCKKSFESPDSKSFKL